MTTNERVPYKTVAENWERRARKAERQLNDWAADLAEAIEDRDKARRERDAETTRADENRDVAVKWQMEALKHERAEQPRALTPDDITDEMVQRGRARFVQELGERGAGLVREILTAALTEPQRPHGAEALAGLISDGMEAQNWADDHDRLADYLAPRVRVVTDEDRHTPACEGGDGLPCDICGSHWTGDSEEEA